MKLKLKHENLIYISLRYDFQNLTQNLKLILIYWSKMNISKFLKKDCRTKSL